MRATEIPSQPAAAYGPAVLLRRLAGVCVVIAAVVVYLQLAQTVAPAHSSGVIVGGIPAGPPPLVLPSAAEADGVITYGASLFDVWLPAIANLDAALRQALRAAATDAADDGVAFTVNSGWRSPAYQDHLLREAVAEYGSEEEAARWVATADTSPHVHGAAVDIGPAAAREWLSAYGSAFGLCQVYRNEPWHYELRPAAVSQGCPPMYPDPSFDPRLWQ